MESKKWQHDRFDERSQAPKSRQEIVAAYGFDIRTNQDSETRISNKLRNVKKLRLVKIVHYITYCAF